MFRTAEFVFNAFKRRKEFTGRAKIVLHMVLYITDCLSCVRLNTSGEVLMYLVFFSRAK